jgi:hypothetical protein
MAARETCSTQQQQQQQLTAQDPYNAQSQQMKQTLQSLGIMVSDRQLDRPKSIIF